jgi:16S rRNA (uracil1498-N3)-methyltransferase
MKERGREVGRVATGKRRAPLVIVPELAAFRGSSEEILLRKEERAHVRSRRLRDGDEVVALDGLGARARACLTRRGTALRLLAFEGDPRHSSSLLKPSSPAFASLQGEPALRVTVLLACAEPRRIEWAVEKGTECGAAGFVLLEAERSQRAHVAALKTRTTRLCRIAAEATKQCGRTLVPTIEGPMEIEDFLRREDRRGEARRPLAVADAGSGPLRSVLRSSAFSDSSSRGVVIAVGPEGGFNPAELFSFEEFGALRVSLGPRILRLETAVVAALTLLVGGS